MDGLKEYAVAQKFVIRLLSEIKHTEIEQARIFERAMEVGINGKTVTKTLMLLGARGYIVLGDAGMICRTEKFQECALPTRPCGMELRQLMDMGDGHLAMTMHCTSAYNLNSGDVVDVDAEQILDKILCRHLLLKAGLWNNLLTGCDAQNLAVDTIKINGITVSDELKTAIVGRIHKLQESREDEGELGFV
jgi:hypothetical protein